MKNMKGIYTALLTPFSEDGRVKERELVRLVRHNLALGADGFYVCGSTAEALMLSVEERMAIMDIVKDSAGDARLIAHIGSLNERDAHRLADHANKLSYDLISSVAPYYYKFTFDEIKNYYFRLAEGSEIKMLVYHFPIFSGVNMGVSELSAFLENDRFAGVKYTANDFFTLEQCKTRYPDKLFFNGYDEMMLSGLAAGADGGVGSTYNFMADKFVAMREHFACGRIQEAQELQREANRIISVLCGIGVMKAEKEIMNQLGLDFGHALPPFSQVSEEERELIAKKVMPYIKPYMGEGA